MIKVGVFHNLGYTSKCKIICQTWKFPVRITLRPGIHPWIKGAVQMCCCCIGYFLYDTVALINNIGVLKSWPMLLHHLISLGKVHKFSQKRFFFNFIKQLKKIKLRLCVISLSSWRTGRL